jgi:hypothetical protein
LTKTKTGESQELNGESQTQREDVDEAKSSLKSDQEVEAEEKEYAPFRDK